MEKFKIVGGAKVEGKINVQASKNAVLPIMAASIMTEEAVQITNAPCILDVFYMGQILEELGCKVKRENQSMVLDASSMHSYFMPEMLSKKIRSSIFMLGPLLSKFKKAVVPYPGGCEIGLRPIDLHIACLKALHVKVEEKAGFLYCDGEYMKAGEIQLDYPSVGATENAMLCAVLLKGKTLIHNAAREPEIKDLQNFVNEMGGNVQGAGSETIQVTGVKKLHGCMYTPIPDRIVAGTLLCAGAITGGKIQLNGAHKKDMGAVLSKLQLMGCEVRTGKEYIYLSAPHRLRPLQQVKTQPYPGFPTDMQAQLLTLLSVSEGTSVVIENVFENRFSHAVDLNKMGADIFINERTAVIKGVPKLCGAKTCAKDLRGGAALVLAGLKAEGETVVQNVECIDRGYQAFEQMLASLGQNIIRI